MLTCHSAFTSEIRTCIINYAVRQAAYRKKTTKIQVFLVESRQTMSYTHVLKVYINFQRKKKIITEINDIIPLNRYFTSTMY